MLKTCYRLNSGIYIHIELHGMMYVYVSVCVGGHFGGTLKTLSTVARDERCVCGECTPTSTARDSFWIDCVNISDVHYKF